MWPHAILFDFDGVIVNSEPLHFFAFHTVLKEEKIDLSETQYYHDLIGYDDKGAFKRIYELNNRPLDPKTFLRVMTNKKEAMLKQINSRKYAALPGVESFVRGVWRHYPLAICSGALGDEIELMLEGISLRDCFTLITSAEDVEKGKPDPSGYLQTIEKLSEKIKHKLTPSDCLIIEDAPPIIKTVREKKFPVLALSTSHKKEKLKEAGANWITATLDPDEVQKQIPGLRMTR